MLTHPTYSRLVALGLNGMAKALEEQCRQPDIAALDFEERLALMVDREHWHEIIGDPTIADAILDRLVHNAYRLTLKGESLRKAAAKRHNLDAETTT
jgi:hypothetical protein